MRTEQPYLSSLFFSSIGRDEYRSTLAGLEQLEMPSLAKELAAITAGLFSFLMPISIRLANENPFGISTSDGAREALMGFGKDWLGLAASFIIGGAVVIAANQMGYLPTEYIPNEIDNSAGAQTILGAAAAVKVGINMGLNHMMNRNYSLS